MKIADDIMVKAEKAGDRLAFVSDVMELPEGTDIYMGSTTSARQISRAIVNEMGGTIIESPQSSWARRRARAFTVSRSP